MGVNILGGEVEGKVGVNFGIGAHADLGYKDGVIKADVGLSVGLGVSAAVEIDIGGMVNKYYKSIKANITATLILSILCVSGLVLSSITHGVLQVLCNSVCVVSFWFASIYLSRSINRKMSNKQEE